MTTAPETVGRPAAPAPTVPGTPVADPVVVTDRLTKRYGRRTVVDALSLGVRRGEVFGFLGPNGAGKTTTLRMLLGLVRPTSGSATVLGRPAGASVAEVGALVEGPGLYPFLSGRDNLRVLARYAGVGTARVDAVLDTVDLADRAGDRFGTYSLGMKQRLGIAAALLKDPALVVLDEPTNGLDPAGISEVRGLLRRLAGEGRTVVLSSHLLGEVEHLCDRVAVVASGRLLVESTVDDLRGLGRLVVDARPLDTAAAVARRLLGPDRVSVVDGALHLQTSPGETAAVNRALVLADVDVTGLRQEARTLEEVFLQLTDGDAGPPPDPAPARRTRTRRGER
ncbi:ABC-2 type transport system ATP-binding protein [Geodermatophilus normandii]|uniref:ABC-2 type transport system ATP-binding protein n=1 Tax=Geodermatophilus normandii TaxID=1137989 RepID=A0A317QK53_9ACTN|nr:ABC transporter ATP-binding protein [Geodermatophilus normandii]PWW22020.1 ABC-2 type transport system ATP-binding protein [Geodermatophilus normandii]